MPVKMQPTNSIMVNLGIDANGFVQRFFTQSCYNHMDKYVPMDFGDLRTNVSIQPTRIIYESPYAHAQYIGMVNGTPVENYTTPGTGAYWDRLMVSAEIDDVIRETQKFMRW